MEHSYIDRLSSLAEGCGDMGLRTLGETYRFQITDGRMISEEDELQAVLNVFEKPKTVNKQGFGALARAYVSKIRCEPEDFNVEVVEAVLESCKRHKAHEALLLIADHLLPTGRGSPKMSRLYAQSLIEVGHLPAANAWLEHQLLNFDHDAGSLAEIHGLIGRLKKQIFVDQRPSHFHSDATSILADSVAAYARAFEPKYPQRNYWHGINLVALSALAKRDGIALHNAFNEKAVAQSIIEALEPIAERENDNWILATIGEAQLALGDTDQATAYYERFILHPSTKPFDINSARRQLIEIWGVSPSDPELGALLMAMEAHAVDDEYGRLALSYREAHDRIVALRKLKPPASQHTLKLFGALEAAHGAYRQRPIDWLKRLVESGMAVARISLRSGQHIGSGFLVSGTDLGCGNGPLLVTSNHVICDPTLPGATAELGQSRRPERMVIRLDHEGSAVDYHCKVVWQSPIQELDVSLLRLSPASHDVPQISEEFYPILRLAQCEPEEFVNTTGRRRRQRLIAIGYPHGGPLSFSWEGNLHRGVRPRQNLDWPRFVYYSSPTAPGGSGGPVLNEDLDVVAVHRAGARTLQDGLSPDPSSDDVNEGTSTLCLKEALQRRPNMQM